MFLEKTDRKILPRWRDFLTTAALGELGSQQKPSSGSLASKEALSEQLHAWTTAGGLGPALDLVGAALVLGLPQHSEVLRAAQFIEHHSSEVPGAASAIAGRILSPAFDQVVADVSDEAREDIYRQIHLQRARTRVEPRNSIAWVDLARLHTIVGNLDKARRDIDIASRLSPDNRFILRSAARFYVHISDYAHALRLLRRTGSVTADPWVSAAEIGISTLIDTPSRIVKPARRLVEDPDLSPLAITELASVLGTLELHGGRQKTAKRLFLRSLVHPTENSLAQAEWASEQVSGLDVDVRASVAPRTYEACTLNGLTAGDWKFALSNAERWLQDQAFSSRPAIVLSYLYSTISERFADAVRVLETSLLSNPGDRRLTNNLAFALVSQGQTSEAERLLAATDFGAQRDLSTITLLATKGLVLFRKGEAAAGRTLYLEAMSLADEMRQEKYKAMAALYLAREEILASLPTKRQTLRMAAELASTQQQMDVALVLERVNKLAGLSSTTTPDLRK